MHLIQVVNFKEPGPVEMDSAFRAVFPQLSGQWNVWARVHRPRGNQLCLWKLPEGKHFWDRETLLRFIWANV